MDSHPWLGLCLAGQFKVKSGISYRSIPTDADAIAVITVQTSTVIAYTLYDSNLSQYVGNVGCMVVYRPVKYRVIYNDRFLLLSVKVRVNGQHTPVVTVGVVWESAADTWTSHVAIATADLGCLRCDWTHVAWQGLHMAVTPGVGE